MIELGLNINREKAIKMIQEIVKEYGSNYSKHYNYFIRRYNRLESIEDKITYSFQFKYISAAVMAYHAEQISPITCYDDVFPCLKNLKELAVKSKNKRINYKKIN